MVQILGQWFKACWRGRECRMIMKNYQKKRSIKRILAVICSVAVICSGMPAKAGASYADVKYMNIDSLKFYFQDADKIYTKVGTYLPSLNESPYVLAIPQILTASKTKQEYHNIGIEDDVFKNQTFSMIYVQTGYGFTVGARAFQNVKVYYAQDRVTDMDVDFWAQDGSGSDHVGITDIGEYAFYYMRVTDGYFHIDKLNGSIGAHAFEGAIINEDLTIASGMIDEIGECAFKNVKASKIKLPSYRKVGKQAFANVSVTSMALSDSLEELGSQVWEGCTKLKKITLPEEPGKVNSVAEDAFPDKEGLTIRVPAGYEDLSVYHFDNYQNLSYSLDESYTENSSVYQQLKATGAQVTIENDTQETGTPEPSDPAEVISTPKPSDSVEITNSPEPAGTTDTPDRTEAPNATKTPDGTEIPDATKTPQGTDTPVLKPTNIPEITPALDPVESSEPAETSAPNNTTEVPVINASEAPDTTEVSQTGKTATENTQTPQQAMVSPSAPAEENRTGRNDKPLQKGDVIAAKGIKYRILSRNTAACIGLEKPVKGKLVIPDKFKYQQSTYRITQIAPKAFYKNKRLKSVILGKNVQEIGKSAFEQCSFLKTVTFGKGMTKIRQKAFYKDRSIVKLDFRGGGLKRVEKNAFSRGKQSKKVFVPGGVKKEKYYKLLQGSMKS